jgi:hypothetical protein
MIKAEIAIVSAFIMQMMPASMVMLRFSDLKLGLQLARRYIVRVLGRANFEYSRCSYSKWISTCGFP